MVTLEKIEPIRNGFARLRAAPLEAAGEQKIYIYKNATMRIADFYPEEFNLSSLYVLRQNLEQLLRLRDHLMDRHSIDILKLDNILHLRKDNGELVGMAPPVVESYEETVDIVPKNGDRAAPTNMRLKIPILKDGMHRAWIAHHEGLSISCVAIHGALPEWGTYAYPNAWDQVKEYDEKPPLKKYFRRQEPYSFMRPLSALRQIGDTAKAEWNR